MWECVEFTLYLNISLLLLAVREFENLFLGLWTRIEAWSQQLSN